MAIARINQLSLANEQFLLITDFKCQNNHVIPVNEIDSSSILFDINGETNFQETRASQVPIDIKKDPISFEKYKESFEQVHAEITAGNTYLLNLTHPTPIQCSADLRSIFHQANAKYKLYFDDQFVVFSPETFVQISKGEIASFPMKGTIDATLPDAKHTILSSEKEMAEHAAIVDLIRNDMSIRAKQVRVEKFRYIEEIKTSEKHLLQVSSKITGQLPENYQAQLGDIIYSLLPAGSISGTPKKKSLEIIDAAETYDRGYYTGIVGYFDGENFDSGVMIRFIENNHGKKVYKSGGGR